MPENKKNPLYERRLRELQEQSSLIEKDIRSLQRVLKKPGAGEMPTLVSSAYDAPKTSDAPPAVQSTPATASRDVTASTDSARRALEKTFAGRTNRTPPPTGELFAPEELGTVAETQRPLSVDTKRRVVPNTERFASYLSSGSFGKSRPLTHERKIQRNKAIIMAVVVLLIGFMLFRAIM